MKSAVAMMLVLASSLAGASSAFADGWQCQNQDDTLRIKAFNKTQADEGTRNASVMILSDPQLQEGRKTIARFTDVNETLSNYGAFFVADVDLRYSDSNLAGKLIAGTKLGFLDKIVLDVDFKYSNPQSKGESVPASLTLLKRNGEEIKQELSCVRYLKN